MYTLRLATLADVDAIAALIPQSARALSTGFYTAEQTESAIRYVFGPDSQLIHDGTYYVAVAGETMAGCGGWSRRRTLYGGDQAKRGEDGLLDPGREAARIRAFFIHPDWGRRGIGRAIVETCIAAAREAGFREMELAATLPGEPLYRASGFEVTSREEVTLPDGVLLPLAMMRRSIIG